MAKVVFLKVFKCQALLLKVFLLIALPFDGLQGEVVVNGNNGLSLLNTEHVERLHLNAAPTYNLKGLYFLSKFFNVENTEENLSIDYGTTLLDAHKYYQSVSPGPYFANRTFSHSSFIKYYILYCCLKISSFNI